MPKNRRSTLATLTAEQETFLRPAQKPPEFMRPDPAPTPEPRARVDVPAGRETSAVPTGHARPLRSVTLRLTPDVAALLRRASIERSLEYQEPFTQQRITEDALRNWLSTRGYH